MASPSPDPRHGSTSGPGEDRSPLRGLWFLWVITVFELAVVVTAVSARAHWWFLALIVAATLVVAAAVFGYSRTGQ